MTARRPQLLVLFAVVVLLSAGCGGGSHHASSSPSVTTDAIPVTYPVLVFTDDGAVVELADGSVWAVAKPDQEIVAADWGLDSQAVSVRNNGTELFNVEDGGAHSVDATKIGTVANTNVDTHLGKKSLSGLGHGAYFAGGADGSLLTLTDGSVWEVTNAFYQQADVEWADGDDVSVSKGPKHTYTLDDTDIHSIIRATYIGQD